ncbi:outer membrane beta-barrel protein [Larkinella terrae]|uniref:TonB-dependent receptor n=1 Tax=Larkinella terrae TaxID=2025311 RepID=A0A7K0EFE5_9BACT|nr:outer membrane beta-barrel protein [Larkinella terrae]MRS60569.1 TonB-dependent receptor [Larkinella terrae]
MKTKIRVIFTLWITIAQTIGLAQSRGQLSGQVVTADQKPVDAAAVSVVLATDSSLVKAELTEANGTFRFANLKTGSYFITISALGFEPYWSQRIELTDSETVRTLEPFQLRTSAIKLKEVVVTGKKEFVEYKLDRTVVNVDALLSNAGTNILEVLQKAPGVMVDQDGNISLKGQSGVLVLIDNRPTYLSANDLAAYLKSLPSGTIDQIELMTNPPARYDAAGKAGVINIKTKKTTIEGFNGSLTANLGRAFYWRHNETVNLNYRKNRFNFFLNGGFNSQDTWRKLAIERRYYGENQQLNTIFSQNSYFYPHNRTPTFKAGMDFYVNSKTTVGFVFTGSYAFNKEKRSVSSALLDPENRPDSLIDAANSQRSRFWQNGINLNFTHQYDSTGRSISVDLDHVSYWISTQQQFQNRFLDASAIEKNRENIRADLPSSVAIYTIRSDYNHPLRNKANLAAGVKSSYVATDNEASYFTQTALGETPDFEKTNRFRYTENINAAYLNFNGEFARFSFQTGLRLENTRASGHQLGNAIKPDSSFTRNYTNLFPTVYLSYRLDSNQNNLIFSYGRRIGRPYYQDLNPFVFLLDKFTYFAGNPFLRPEFGHKFELKFTHKNRLNVTLMYNYVTNMNTETIEQQGAIFISRTGNVGNLQFGGISVNTTLKAGNWWTCNLYAEIIKNRFEGFPGTGGLATGSVYGYINPSNQFLFKNGWSAEVSWFYISRSQSAQFDKSALFALNTGVQKKVLANKGSVRLTLRDAFRSLQPQGKILNIPNATASYHNRFDSRSLTVSFTYNFSKGATGKQKRNTSGAGSEQDRVKN